MAIGQFFRKLTRNREPIDIEGSFAPNGVGAVDAASNEGLGFSVARTGVGVFVITFKEKFQSLIALSCNLQLSALADTDVQFGAMDLSAKTLTLRVKTAGVAADIAANAANRIHFCATFRNNTVKPVRGLG